MPSNDAQSNPTALPQDAFGNPIQGIDIPVDHPAFQQQRVYKNANGDVVKLEMDFAKPGGGTKTFRKLFTPPNLDTTPAGSPYVINPWVEVI
jgi:hypothetical protein